MSFNLLRSANRLDVLRRFLRPTAAFSSSSSSDTVCRIGCASGFWGDTAVASSQLLRRAQLDYLVFDYLSEITMTLLNAARAKNTVSEL